MRVLLHHRSGGGLPVTASVQQDTLTLALGSAVVHTFDVSGRWLAGAENGQQWRRSYDHRLVHSAAGGRPQPVGDPHRVRSVLDKARGDAHTVLDGLDHGTLTAASGCNPWLPVIAQVLRRAADFDATALEADGARFRDLYGGVIPALPGELRWAMYLQTVQGCSWNRCQFCQLYAGRRHRVPTLPELDRHVRDVLAWYGPAIALRRSLFLGDADALEPGGESLLRQLGVIERHVCIGPADGHDQRPRVGAIDCFTTTRSVLRATPAELTELARAGLRRAYLGLETGHQALYHAMLRRDPLASLGRGIERLHAAGIAVGLTVIVGLGGDRWRDEHVDGTVARLTELPLTPEDRVCLSPLTAPPGSRYDTWAERTLAAALSQRQLREQAAQIEQKLLESWRPGTGPRIAAYSIEVPPW